MWEVDSRTRFNIKRIKFLMSRENYFHPWEIWQNFKVNNVFSQAHKIDPRPHCGNSWPEIGPPGTHLCQREQHQATHTLPDRARCADLLPEDGPATLVAWSQTGISVESYNKCRKEEWSIWKHLLGFYFWSKAPSYSERGRNVLCFKIRECWDAKD